MGKKKPTGSGFSLKDQLFNRDRVRYLANLFAASNEEFDADGFERAVMRRLKKLELKERIVHIAATLEDFLSEDFSIASRQIDAALPTPLDPGKTDGDFGDFVFASLGEYVVRNGMKPRHVKRSLKTIHNVTQRFSMEDAIRYFINEHPDQTMAALEKWVADKNYHVRRLVSEGTRPRLPWSSRISIDVTSPIGLLDELHADNTRYVTRSVANHLNDISKSHPELTVTTLRRWKKWKRQDEAELQWMSRHALRTLVKQGHPGSLRFLGFRPDPRITVSEVELSQTSVRPGESLEFSFDVTASRDEMLMIDYAIEFVKSNGKRSPKVHKIKQARLAKGESLTVKKRHPFRAGATTFTLYPGTHYLTIQINGNPTGRIPFEMGA